MIVWTKTNRMEEITEMELINCNVSRYRVQILTCIAMEKPLMSLNWTLMSSKLHVDPNGSCIKVFVQP